MNGGISRRSLGEFLPDRERVCLELIRLLVERGIPAEPELTDATWSKARASGVRIGSHIINARYDKESDGWRFVLLPPDRRAYDPLPKEARVFGKEADIPGAADAVESWLAKHNGPDDRPLFISTHPEASDPSTSG